MPSLIASCYIEFSCYHWESCSFLKGNEGAMDLVVGEAAIGMYCKEFKKIKD